MAQAGFNLRGWESSFDNSKNESTPVLGILWHKRTDMMSINPSVLEFPIPNKFTKRSILSIAHRIFDPIGFTCPVTLEPKLLLKELWSKKLGWDVEIEENLSNKFRIWVSDLKALMNILIPRKIGVGNLSLHTFVDASKSAYGSVVFARVEDNGRVFINFLSAKSRLAPEKATIPLLELLAASIGSRLTKTVIESLSRDVTNITYWSDSSTALAWIRRDLQWGTFVYNRVKEIRSLTTIAPWRFVPGDKNPADLPSRGCSPTELLNSKWWLGPEWLYRPPCEWPGSEDTPDEDLVMSEIKKTVVIQMFSCEGDAFNFLDYFSYYTQLVRFLALTRRLINNFKNKDPLAKPRPLGKYSVTIKEVTCAEISLLKHLQSMMFLNPEKLSSFKVMRNKDDLIVLKTKVFYRDDKVNFTCPILLDSNHDAVYLLVRETHESLGHAGVSIVMTHLRENYWIISLRKLTKQIIAKCIICKKQAAKRLECEASPLPRDRVRNAAVFEVVGLDFAGPLFLRGGEKAWICIFTCAIYRAVHLELASGLSTEAFLECLRRFIARRGRPSVIYSDNGTNFTGASNAFDELNWEKINTYSTAAKIEWYFNPPSAPWWGGWWERLIGILKRILRKVLGKACLTYESLVTVLCDSEAIINSRPLTYVSENSDDLQPLTPAMFLNEIAEFGVPDCDIVSDSKRLIKKLLHRQKVLVNLRKRFRVEYLGQLLIRNNKKEKRVLGIGDVVLIGDDDHKRIDWPLARVIDMIPGRDGVSRVIILKTKNGVIRRPIQRVYPLEVEQCDASFSKSSYKKVDRKEYVPPLKNNNVTCNATENNPKIVTTRSGREIFTPDRYKP